MSEAQVLAEVIRGRSPALTITQLQGYLGAISAICTTPTLLLENLTLTPREQELDYSPKVGEGDHLLLEGHET